jgi:hypothetical protein
MRPLRERFQVVHRLAGFDLDDHLRLSAPVLGEEDEVRVQPGRPDGRVLLGPRVDCDVEATAKSGL